MSPFDRSLSRRTLGIALVLLAVATGVVVLTDEAGSTAALRVSRLCALAPALALIAAQLGIAQARARGELMALEALGASPARAAFGAAAAAFCLGIAATALVLSPLADPASLFPAVARPAVWVERAGALVDVAHGVTVDGAGAIAMASAQPLPEVVGVSGPLAAALCIGPLAIAGPVWLLARLGRLARAAGAGLTVVAVIVLLHVVAAGLGAAWLLVLASAPLVAQGAFGHLRWRFT
jgi:hypothetical protein